LVLPEKPRAAAACSDACIGGPRSGDDRPIGSTFKAAAKQNPGSSYGVFLWNGKSADAVIKATALTKAFELERVLLDDGNVERFFNGDRPCSALDQHLGAVGRNMVTAGDPMLTQLLDGNELVRWLVNVSSATP